MNIGFVGLGKLGLPTALAIAAKGHRVVGTDASPAVKDIIATRQLPYREAGAQLLLDVTTLEWRDTIAEVVAESDLIFCAVQTPHAAEYEGVTRLPADRRDFDYTFLRAACSAIAGAAIVQRKSVILAVVSTVLPGTMARHIVPVLSDMVRLVYNPSFIAMGTTIPDYTNPEFVLLGSDDDAAAETVRAFYATIHERPVLRVSVVEAEIAKVLYNTFIGLKLAFANTVGELADKVGADADRVMGVLKQATRRLISTQYLTPGMGDAGGCHPRDNIALSWLARELQVGFDLFTAVMMQRERHQEWLAETVAREAANRGLSVVILGTAYKPNVNLVVGSCSFLLAAILEERGVFADKYDPVVGIGTAPDEPCVAVLATPHAELGKLELPAGSVLIDPWGVHPGQPGVLTMRPGRLPRAVVGPVAA